MKTSVLWLIMASIVSAGPAFGQGTNDETAVVSTFDALRRAINSGDMPGFLATVTDDIMLLEMMPTEAPAVGKEAVRQMVEGLFDGFDVMWSGIETDTVIVVEDLAFHHYRGVFSATPKEGGETSSSPRRYLDIFRRQADGGWKLWQHTLIPLEHNE